jgi:hypothetical protein
MLSLSHTHTLILVKHTAEPAAVVEGDGTGCGDTDEGGQVSRSEGEETVSIVQSSLGGGGDRVFFLVPSAASNEPQQLVKQLVSSSLLQVKDLEF